MALYSVSLRQARERSGKALYKWTNRFYTEASDASTAAARGVAWWTTSLRGAVRVDVWCYEVYATDVVPPDGGGTPATTDFATLPVPAGQARGLVIPDTGASGEAYWRDLALVVELTVANSRPDRKFWRPGFVEGDFSFSGTFDNPGLATLALSAFLNIVASGEWRSGDGEAISGVAVKRVTTRRLGRLAFLDLPPSPPVG